MSTVPRLGDLRALVERSPVTTLVFGLPDQRVRISNSRFRSTLFT